jgi:hypothetical protein
MSSPLLMTMLDRIERQGYNNKVVINKTNMENVIDQRYRQIIFDTYFDNPTLTGTPGFPKWVAPCPFCSHTRKTPSKQKSKCAVLLWVPTENSWKFSCRNGGSVQCSYAMSFLTLLKNLNPALARQYVLDRYSAGTTGKGTNCPNPEVLKQFGQPPKFRSRSKPQNQDPKRPDQSKPEGGQNVDRPQS